MNAVVGTGALLRLALRRDRLKLVVWISIIASLLAASTAANVDLYNTAAERTTYATTTAVSMVSRILGGPIAGTSIGSIIVLETFLMVAVLVAFMNTFTVMRHTRQNEETNRSELIGSMPVGRQAPLAAALLVAISTSIVVGLLSTTILTLILGSASFAGALTYGLSIMAIGCVFAGVAAVAAQISQNARTANGIAAACIGIAFLLRGVGDALGTISANGTVLVSNWLAWTSPLGWGFFMHPFTGDHWWIMGLFILLVVLLIWVAIVLSERRDVGAGLVAARSGPSKASRSLLSPLGLAWRLQRGTYIGWCCVMAIVGIGFGASGKEFENFFAENEQLARAIAQTGTTNLVDGLFVALMTFTGVMVVAYVVQALLRLRSEEIGSLELVLATGVSRQGWMMSHVMIATLGAASLIVFSGTLCALTYGLITGDMLAQSTLILSGAIVQIPALLVVASCVIVCFAVLPRVAVAFGWLCLAFVLFIAQLGLMLTLPRWLLDLSPFTHVPNVAVGIPFTPLAVLTAIAVTTTGVGLICFRRRNLVTA